MDLNWIFDILASTAFEMPSWLSMLFLPIIGYFCWQNVYDSNDLADAIDKIGINEAGILISYPLDINENLTIPSNITLRFIRGGTLNVGKFSIRNATYQWTVSPAQAGEYYLELAGGGDPGLTNPLKVYEDNILMGIGVLGTLAVGEWNYGNNDALGFNTIYVRIAGDADPDGEAVDYVEAGYVVTINGHVEAGGYQIFSGTGTVVVNTYPQEWAWWKDIERHVREENSFTRRAPQPLVTFVFDDAYETDFTLMKPLFDAQGELAVSAIITDRPGGVGRLTWAQIIELDDDGWEIVNHTKTHADLTGLTEAQVRNEFILADEAFKAHGIVARNFAYPGGTHNNLVRRLASEYFLSARAVGGNSNKSPLRTYALTAMSADDDTLGADYQAAVDEAESNNGWLLFYIHETDANDVVTIGALIDYIQGKGIPIVTINQGLKLVGNAVDIGSEAAIGIRGIRLSRIEMNEESEEEITIGHLAGSVVSTGRTVNIGYYAGHSNTTGHSVSIGYIAGGSNTTGRSINIGDQAGNSNIGGHSVNIGYKAGFTNIGGHSVNVGYEAGFSNTTGHSVNVGYSAGRSNTIGLSVNVGYWAGYDNTTGHSVNIGYEAGRYNTVGASISIGYRAGYGTVVANAPVTDTYGILIGVQANRSVASATVLTNYIGIGYGVLIDKDNQTKIGNDATVECYLRGSLLLDLASVPAHANNAAAAGGGVAVGGIYRTNADPSVLCIRSA